MADLLTSACLIQRSRGLPTRKGYLLLLAAHRLAAARSLMAALTKAEVARQAAVQVSRRGDTRLPQRPVGGLHGHAGAAGPAGLQRREGRGAATAIRGSQIAARGLELRRSRLLHFLQPPGREGWALH